MAKTLKENSIVQLETPVGGTYFKHGRVNLMEPEVCVPKDRYVILKKTPNHVRIAVQLGDSCVPHPSSKHIYEISKRNFWALEETCKVKR